MVDRLFLVVCEGSSDFAIIDGLIRHTGDRLGKNFQARLQEPQLDATSGRYDKFGFEGVKAWCKRVDFIQKTNGRDSIGMLLTLARADFMLIHMDCDIANRIDIDGTGFLSFSGSRRNWCEKAINLWIGIANGKKDCRYILPTWQIETWILATYDKSNAPSAFTSDVENYETIQDVEGRLLSLGYKADNTKPNRLYKEKELFSNDPRYTKKLLQDLPLAISRCMELEQFVNFLNNS